MQCHLCTPLPHVVLFLFGSSSGITKNKRQKREVKKKWQKARQWSKRRTKKKSNILSCFVRNGLFGSWSGISCSPSLFHRTGAVNKSWIIESASRNESKKKKSWCFAMLDLLFELWQAASLEGGISFSPHNTDPETSKITQTGQSTALCAWFTLQCMWEFTLWE